MANQFKIITISLPEYAISTKPNYEFIGAKIDRVVEDNFEGTFLVRALSIADHPRYTIDQLAEVILRIGTDKYDLSRKGVSHEEFDPYKPDLQAAILEVKNGKIVGESFGEDVRRFYENALFDRGYKLRIDLLVLYDLEQMVQAEKIDHTKPSTQAHLEKYLWRFKNPKNKTKAIRGIVKILK